MAHASARLSIEGMLKLIKKSRWPLAPVFEAIANALEAIEERQRHEIEKHTGEIKVRFYFTGILAEVRKLERIEIEDNGIGFNSDNFARFQTFLDRSKGFNNRGSGRVQFLHFAKRIDVLSYYQSEAEPMQRRFVCTLASFITNQENGLAPNGAKIGSTITLRDLETQADGSTKFDQLTIEELASSIKSHFLLRLHLARVNDKAAAPVMTFEFFKNEQLETSRSLSALDLPEPETGDIAVPVTRIKDSGTEKLEWRRVPSHTEKLHWAHFKLPAAELNENGVVLCSKGVAVKQGQFEGLKKQETVDGHRFLTAIHGEVFNRAESVSDTVDDFTLPTRADVERSLREGDLFFNPDQDIVFFDDIEAEISKVLPSIYSDLLERREEKGRDVAAIATAHGIPIEMVAETTIGLSDNEAQITEKLFKTQAAELARRSLKIKKLFENLVSLDPSSENYESDLEERSHTLLELIPEQNKQELSRYVIRRQMVAKVLGLILDKKVVGTKKSVGREAGKMRADREGLVHDLIIKRKSPSTTGPNDLWVLNEEFVHFEGCSEIPLDKIIDAKGEALLGHITDDDLDRYGIKHKKRRRPDIFLFAEESQCVLIELKAPEIELSDHLLQLEKYCNLIANFAVRPITRFHCYLIGETVSPMDVAGRYRQNLYGDWVSRTAYKVMGFGNHPIFKRPDFWTSRGKFQFHGGGYSADAHVRALVVVSP